MHIEEFGINGFFGKEIGQRAKFFFDQFNVARRRVLLRYGKRQRPRSELIVALL